MDETRPVKVAVLGGGCAALTTAYELTRPEHRGRYDVTVYQLGFRLGGKGASGRGPADRIEEHGLHIWMGFYENAFRLMRECYADLGRDPATCPIVGWRQAFTPSPVVGVTNRGPGGAWDPWIAHFPAGRGLPGDPLVSGALDVRGYLERAVALLVELVRSASVNLAQGTGSPEPHGPDTPDLSDGTGGPWDRSPRGPSLPTPEDVVGAIDRVLRFGQLATAAAIVEAAELLGATLGPLFGGPSGGRPGPALGLLEAISAAARRQLELLVGGDGELGRVWEVVDVILAILRGAIRFNLAFDPRGFDAIDDYDYREWLRMNGASARSLDSGFIRGIYDLVFAYADGDTSRPALSAAVALRGAMRMFFTYRGALFWRMSAGMGDIVFAPLYEVLSKRGVKFEFFHRLSNIQLARAEDLAPGERPFVKALELDVQAELADGRTKYDPLVTVHGLPCWPAEPHFDQLADGARLEAEAIDFESPWEKRIVGKRTLHVSKDFDLVVLGLGLGAIPAVAKELIDAEPRWRAMVDNVKTVATQAFQVWLREDMGALGWKVPNVSLSGYVEPFDTWADMSHLLPKERWNGRARAIGYFCSVLANAPSTERIEPLVAETEHARVRRHAIDFLNRDVPVLWPKAATPEGGFRFELLVDGTDVEGAPSADEAAFDGQYWTANIRPSDLYVLSAPGTSRHRISPLDRSFDNLTIAGDWTASGLGSGCVESAVMSGLLAAHALCEQPALEEIVGYDHP
jgi:uncharacterized protein with NAD-binding domain and iron-sulfur cluster